MSIAYPLKFFFNWIKLGSIYVLISGALNFFKSLSVSYSCLQGKQQGFIIILWILLWSLEDIIQFHEIMKAMAWLNNWSLCQSVI